MKKIISCVSLMFLLLMLLPALPTAGAERGEQVAKWVKADEGAFTGDYAFSLAVVGDTQTLCFRGARGDASYQNAMPGL